MVYLFIAVAVAVAFNLLCGRKQCCTCKCEMLQPVDKYNGHRSQCNGPFVQKNECKYRQTIRRNSSRKPFNNMNIIVETISDKQNNTVV